MIFGAAFDRFRARVMVENPGGAGSTPASSTTRKTRRARSDGIHEPEGKRATSCAVEGEDTNLIAPLAVRSCMVGAPAETGAGHTGSASQEPVAPVRSCDTCRYGDNGPEPDGCSASCWEPELPDWDPEFDYSPKRRGGDGPEQTTTGQEVRHAAHVVMPREPLVRLRVHNSEQIAAKVVFCAPSRPGAVGLAGILAREALRGWACTHYSVQDAGSTPATRTRSGEHEKSTSPAAMRRFSRRGHAATTTARGAPLAARTERPRGVDPTFQFRAIAQLEARLVWVQQVPCSNHGGTTGSGKRNPAHNVAQAPLAAPNFRSPP